MLKINIVQETFQTIRQETLTNLVINQIFGENVFSLLKSDNAIDENLGYQVLTTFGETKTNNSL